MKGCLVAIYHKNLSIISHVNFEHLTKAVYARMHLHGPAIRAPSENSAEERNVPDGARPAVQPAAASSPERYAGRNIYAQSLLIHEWQLLTN